jgi:hypothetical protein
VIGRLRGLGGARRPAAQHARAGALGGWALLLCAICAVVLALVTAPPPAPRQLALGAGGDEPYIENFWLPEQSAGDTFRWTNGAGIIWFREFAGARAVLVSLRLSGADGAPTPLTLRSDERPVGVLPVTSTWRTYHLLLAPDGGMWRTPNVDLVSPTFSSGPSDMRRLGVVVSDATVRAMGEPLLAVLLLRAVTLAALVALVWLWAGLLAPPPAATLIALAVGLAAALLWRLDPTAVDRALPSPWLRALGATGAGMLYVYVARWRRGPRPLAGEALLGPHRAASTLLIVTLAAAVGVTALLSLRWGMLHDAPLLMYIALLIDRFGALPYRDIYDQNMPAAFAFYVLVGRIFGYGDLGFRLADLCVLALIGACTWCWGRPMGARYGLVAALLFALIYLSYGAALSLQRDIVLLLPVAGALAASVSALPGGWRFLLAGLLFGLAAAIKPHAAIGFPPLLLFLLAEEAAALPRPRRRPLAAAAGLALLGLVIPAAATVAYLAAAGVLDDFLAMALNYLPLFARLTGLHQTIAGPERVRYLFEGYLAVGGHQLWVGAGLVGAAVALRWGRLNPSQRRQVLLMLGLALCYSFYPLFQGRFWDYHFLPLLYTLALLAALCALPQPGQARLLGHLAPLALLVAVIGLRVAPAEELSYQITGHPLPPFKAGRVEQIAGFLSERVRPGETVQPLDWTGGALHAMLIAGVPAATPFIYDFQFYHHVREPYIQGLRQRFIAELEAARPRFILDINDISTIISGADAASSFPELEAVLAREYVPVLEGDSYVIYERR